MRGLDASASRPSLASRALGVDTVGRALAKQQAQQHRELFRRLVGLGNIEGSIYGKLSRNIASLGSPGLATDKRSVIGTVGPMVSSKTSLLSSVIESSPLNPRNPLPGVSGINHTLASEAFKVIDTKWWLISPAQPKIDMRPWFNGQTSNVGLGAEVARAFQARGLDETLGAAWTLRRVWFRSNPVVRSILKNTTSFGPIVVRPDYEDDAPFDYQPDLRDFIPDTDTESGEDFDIEELWAEAVAFAQGIARHHRTEVLLSAMGNGHRYLIRVSKHPAVAATIGGAAGGAVSGDVIVGAVSGGVSGFVTYLLTRE